jgi:hypothetical protein
MHRSNAAAIDSGRGPSRERCQCPFCVPGGEGGGALALEEVRVRP